METRNSFDKALCNSQGGRWVVQAGIIVSTELSHEQYRQALAALDRDNYTVQEKIDMLIEIAMAIQTRPKTAGQLFEAITLYDQAFRLCTEDAILLKARIKARKATALQVVPGETSDHLFEAQKLLLDALPIISEFGSSQEAAEAQLNLGLTHQALASCGKGKITDAIDCYQRSLRVFRKEEYPAEYVILHNNLATAYLSIPVADSRGKMREALAVQSFEAALEVVTLEDDPNEYAMLQNNLGNALQYVSSSHVLENNLRALAAYDEALKVRTERTTPLLYASTIANKANCLSNLPDDMNDPGAGNMRRLSEAKSLYAQAEKIFRAHGELEKAGMLQQKIDDLESCVERNHQLQVEDGYEAN
jgi:tetratricopeptide (TPR) repeat protein